MMKKPMLNAIQKVKMSMAMKSKNPKMNPGFDSLPKEVQNKINNQVNAEIERLKSKNPSEMPKIPSSKNSDSAFNPFENQ